MKYFCVHIVCNEIQVKVNLEITTFFFYCVFHTVPTFSDLGCICKAKVSRGGSSFDLQYDKFNQASSEASRKEHEEFAQIKTEKDESKQLTLTDAFQRQVKTSKSEPLSCKNNRKGT